ncbi:MAG: sulfatase-like hydrolase/transferase [Bryobacterales bacterium]|nr:sulfatase-like hydrolase/transferase [Bryobacterales bacterium]
MKRRDFLFSLAAAPAARRRPNIVLILADDLGSADLSCYGSKDLRTPAIDSIAAGGLRFRQAYANAPECSPSRCALLTGRYQQRVGGLECAIGLANVGRYDEAVWLQERGELGLPTTEMTLPKLLKKQGYSTAIFGKWHLGYHDKFGPNGHGFDEFFGILGGAADYFKYTEQDGAMVLRHNAKSVHLSGYLTDLVGENASKWLQKRTKNTPFFLYVPFTAPHNPFQTREDEAKPLAQWNGANRPAILKMIEQMDERIGGILRQIDAMGERENTIVLFMSDNGAPVGGSNAPLRGGKSQVYEGGIRMPLVIRWPGVLAPGSTTDQVTLMMDVTATLAAAAGVTGAKFDGINLLGEWRGERPVRKRTVFWRYKREKNRRKAVRDGDWKLVSNNGKEELFDLRADPEEKEDRIGARPEEAARLRQLLAGWEKATAAPRLREFKG